MAKKKKKRLSNVVLKVPATFCAAQTEGKLTHNRINVLVSFKSLTVTVTSENPPDMLLIYILAGEKHFKVFYLTLPIAIVLIQ